MAATPPVASADPSSPLDSAVGDLEVTLAATPFFDPDISISFNGVNLFQEGNAKAISGPLDLAIAIGDESRATAGQTVNGFYFPGMFDTAFGFGPEGVAYSGAGNFDTAIAFATANLPGFATVSQAGAGGLSGSPGSDSSGDFAFVLGQNVAALAGNNGGVPMGNLDVASVFNLFGSHGGSASAENGILDIARVVGDHDNALASQGNLDFASVFGNNSVAEAGAIGSYDLASVFGDGLRSTSAIGTDFVSDFLSGPF